MILILWIVVVLSVIATSLAFDVQVNSKLARLQHDQFIAYNLARSAIAVGMNHLQNDLLIDFQENPNQPCDALSDVWAQPGLKEGETEIQLGEGTYETMVTDEESKLNINTVSPKIIKAMLEYYGYEPPDSDDIAAAIIDWRDQDDTVSGAQGDKENEKYSALAGQKIRANTAPEELIYQCRNEPFLTVDELLDVYGITPELYHGYDPDSDEAREQKIRNDIAMGKKVTETQKEGGGRGKRREGLALKDILTVHGNGKVNLNTASREVLTILIYAGTNCTNMESATASADSIIEFRGSEKRGRGPDPDDAFRSVNDVAKVSGVSATALQAIGSGGGSNAPGGGGLPITFSSNMFCIKGIGRARNVKKTITTVVQRTLDTYNPDDARLVGNKSRLERKERRPHRSSNGKTEDNYVRIPAIRVLQWTE